MTPLQRQLARHPFPISCLSLDTLTRDNYGCFDALILAQLAPLCENPCYQPKIYRAPALSNELLAANGYTSHTVKITPGAIIYGFYLPPSSVSSNLPGQFNVQIYDTSLKHFFYDQPVPSYFLANNKPTYLPAGQNVLASFPNLLEAPHPVVGRGSFGVELWETSGEIQRVELVFGVLEPFGEACL